MGTVTTIVTNEDDKEVAEKVYRTRYPGSAFIGPDGASNAFDIKGELRTTSYLLQKELDKVAGKPGCPIFVDNYVKGSNEDAPSNELRLKAEAAVAALQAQTQGIANGTTVS